jgi:uncharacterized membrane protein (DUF2068 family)
MRNSAAPVSKPRLTAGYLWIIAFKYGKLVSFLVLGIAALRASRLPQGSLAQEAVRLFGAYENSPLVQHLASVLSVLTPIQIKELGAASILLGLVFGAEGTLLALRIWWAPYLTVVLTALALPLELVEIAHHPTSLRRYLLIAANVAVLVYLWKRKDDFKPAAEPAPRA